MNLFNMSMYTNFVLRKYYIFCEVQLKNFVSLIDTYGSNSFYPLRVYVFHIHKIRYFLATKYQLYCGVRQVEEVTKVYLMNLRHNVFVIVTK